MATLRRPRGRGGRRALAAGAGSIVVVASAAAIVVARSGSDGAAAASSEPTATTAIERRDLVEVQTEDGTLGYSDSRTVINRMAGTVTWLPRAGSVVRTNRRLYEVDGRAVYLLDGSVPAYRALGAGTTGDDVRALERNLRELGKDPSGAMRVDGTWDAGTTAAVERWQHGKGLEQTGTIELGRVIFAPGDRRVSSLKLKVGASAGSGSGGGGQNQPAFYDGADAGAASSAMRFVSATTTTPQAATTTAPQATTTPQPTTTTPQTTTTPETTTTPQPTTPEPAARQPAAEEPTAKTPAAPKTPSPAASTGGGGGADRARSSDAASGADTGTDSSVSTELMTTTSTRRIVTVDLDTTKGSVAVKGARVTIELPSGDTVSGRIARVGKSAQSAASADGQGSAPPTIKLTIKLTQRASAIDQAPVSVRLERSRRRDVLAIPVTALLARTGGRFAVEVAEGSERRVVPVTTGLYTSGFVEIEGAGLRAGMRVANAAI
jgi:hypothetical protein